MTESSRIHYMDNIRALAMYLGVVFHAGIAYAPEYQAVWFTAGNGTHPWFDWMASGTHLFRMPLFFLIAGFFAHLLIQKRGNNAYLKNRLLRLGVPFIVFWPLTVVSVVAALFFITANANNQPPIAEFLQSGEAEGSELNTMHLWFIYYLLLFSLVTWILVKAFPSGLNWVSQRILKNNSYLLWSPLLILPASVLIVSPFPAPGNFLPSWWGCLFFGVPFYLGWLIFQHPECLEQFKKVRIYVLGVTIPAFIVFVYLSEPIGSDMIMSLHATIDLEHIIKAFLQSYLALYGSMLSLSYGKDWLSEQNSVMAYVSQSSYWVYIVHFPILLYVQVYTGNLGVHVNWQFLLSLTVTTLLSLLSYQILVRHTPIGWMLNGRKKKKPVQLAETAS